MSKKVKIFCILFFLLLASSVIKWVVFVIFVSFLLELFSQGLFSEVFFPLLMEKYKSENKHRKGTNRPSLALIGSQPYPFPMATHHFPRVCFFALFSGLFLEFFLSILFYILSWWFRFWCFSTCLLDLVLVFLCIVFLLFCVSLYPLVLSFLFFLLSLFCWCFGF